MLGWFESNQITARTRKHQFMLLDKRKPLNVSPQLN